MSFNHAVMPLRFRVNISLLSSSAASSLHCSIGWAEARTSRPSRQPSGQHAAPQGRQPLPGSLHIPAKAALYDLTHPISGSVQHHSHALRLCQMKTSTYHGGMPASSQNDIAMLSIHLVPLRSSLLPDHILNSEARHTAVAVLLLLPTSERSHRHEFAGRMQHRVRRSWLGCLSEPRSHT